MSDQPDYSWQSSPLMSDHCPACKGTGRVKKGAGDSSPLEYKNTELLRKLGRCHEAIRVGMYTINGLLRTKADCERYHPILLQMQDALTDRGGANPE